MRREAQVVMKHGRDLTEEVYHKVADLVVSLAPSGNALALEDWVAILLGIMSALAEMAARVVTFFPANMQGELQKRIISDLTPYLTVGIPGRVGELNRSGGPLKA
jgi:hypothetical protein